MSKMPKVIHGWLALHCRWTDQNQKISVVYIICCHQVSDQLNITSACTVCIPRLSLFIVFCVFIVFLPRDASAERGDATVSRLSVCPSMTFRYQQHIGWNSSKIISRPNSLGPLLWLTPNIGDLVQREHPRKLGLNRGGVTQEHIKPVRSQKRCKIGP